MGLLRRKNKNGLKLDWKLSDLPTDTFQTCRIPDEHGPLKSIFTICGKFRLDFSY